VDEGHYALPEVTVQDMCVFLAIIVQMGYVLRDTLKDYWWVLEQYFMVFYRNAMKQVKFYHIHRFLNFSDHKNDPDKTDENYDQLWKMRAILDKLSDSYAKFYIPTDHLVVDEIMELFKSSNMCNKETQAVQDNALQPM
jgi:hypothetical protein